MLLSRPNFSDLVQVGTLLLRHVQQEPYVRVLIAHGKRRLKAEALERKILSKKFSFEKLGAGSTFGDFTQASGPRYSQ